jgi:predicted ribosomally synthesized peptide with SipW-like signal peptide
MRKNKKLIGAMAVVLAVMTAFSAATFAWFTSKDSVTNHLETDKLTNGDVKIVETWDPEDGKHFDPNTEVNKDVGAINTGSADAFVRISFEEVLNKLQDGLPISLTNPGVTTGTGAYAGLALVPQQVDITAYSGYTELTAASTVFTNIASLLPLTTGLHVVYKANSVTDSFGTKTTYNFAAYYEYATGKYQKVDLPTATVVYDDKGTTTTADDTNVLNLGAVQYQYLARANEAKADWLVGDSNDTPADLFHDSDDFTNSVLGVDANPRNNTWALTDSAKKFIRLIFTDNVSFAASPASVATGDWWYNEDDGWFYYIGVLEPGTATAHNLLDALYLSDLATSEYSDLSFDLTAKSEAIQALADALSATSAGGWSLNTSSAIYAKLAGLL